MEASRGLIALLVGTVVFFALWMVALKPGGSSPASGGRPTQGLSGYKADIAAAHQAVQTSAADNARAGADPSVGSSSATPAQNGGSASTSRAVPVVHTSASHTAPKTTHHAAARSTHGRVVTTRHAVSAATRLSTVQRALRAHKVVALLFYNPAAVDDQAVKQELGSVPTHGGRVVKLTIPISEIANYTAVTEQVPVNFSPTLVLVAPNGQANEIVGFSAEFEITQRLDDALASR